MASPVFVGVPRRMLEVNIDGLAVQVMEGMTILDACRRLLIDTPTLCNLETLTPVNVCRICVVEVEGSRTLVPACSRKVEEGMVVKTDTERVRLSRRLVVEFLASSVDVSTSPQIQAYMNRYGARPQRFGPASPPAGHRDAARAGYHRATDGSRAATVGQPVKKDNELYYRD